MKNVLTILALALFAPILAASEINFNEVPGAAGYAIERFDDTTQTWIDWADAPIPSIASGTVTYNFTYDTSGGVLTVRPCTLSTAGTVTVKACSNYISSTFYPVLPAPTGLGIVQ